MPAFSTLRALKRQPARSLHPSALTRLFSRISNSCSLHQVLTTPLTSLQCGQLLEPITSSRSLEAGRRLHAHLISSGVLVNNTYLGTKLCAMYSISGAMPDARTLFDEVVLKSSFLWNVMVRGYACSDSAAEALLLYREMLEFGKRADNFTYPYVVLACGDLLLVDVGRKVHSELILSGYQPDVYVGNSLLSMYSKFGDMGVAQKVFDIMPKRDVTSWNTLISAYQKNNQPHRSLSVFSVLAASGGIMDRVTLLGVLPACADMMAMAPGKEIHAYILRNCIEFDISLTNSLIDVYANSHLIASARQLFEKASKRDIISWNSIISGYARNGDPFESLRLFHYMNFAGTSPDTVTLIAVLGACDRMAALQHGRSLHAYVTKHGRDRGIILGTSLIDMYSKCGCLNWARQIFDEMATRNLISWSAMVSAYGLHGCGREAIACYNEMKTNGMRPDRITFTSVLAACSHSGLVDEGKQIFYEMSKDFSLNPSAEHYTCIVDLLGRAGHLDEAYNFIATMDVKPNVDIWAALLSACRVHCNVELAEIAARNAFRLNPKAIGPYVCLSNVYASKKRWNDFERIRADARSNGLRKPPGCSFVEFGVEIHRFLVGGKSHPQTESIYAKLNELRKQLKADGYVPNTSSVFYDVGEDVKERMLWDHSERLAIAFALLNTSTEVSIRITKNLRVCEDCHTVTKLISKLVDREIVVRDARRFHHFNNGHCSCGDYW